MLSLDRSIASAGYFFILTVNDSKSDTGFMKSIVGTKKVIGYSNCKLKFIALMGILIFSDLCN